MRSTVRQVDGHKKRLGFIVNPIAGIGGRVGLKGSDGIETQHRALELGAVPQANERATRALECLKPLADNVELNTYPGEMGEDVTRQCGFTPIVIGQITRGATTAQDTRNAAMVMKESGVDLLLFVGGDGTARDICAAIGDTQPALGVPAGVKIHSAVFAINPRGAGELAAGYLLKPGRLREAEVMDLDEDAFRRGIISAQLYGYLRIPFERRLVQNQKAASQGSDAAAMDAIACDVIENMEPDCLYIIGPGTTTRAIASRLGLPKTLVGVDVIIDSCISNVL